MADIGWLFGWAKENGIEIPLNYDGSANIPKLFELYDAWREKNGERETARKNIELSKQDWARVYAKLGEIKRGGAVNRRSNGDMIIPLQKMSETDTPKIVFVGGTYEKPKMRQALVFNSDEEMFDMLEDMKWR